MLLLIRRELAGLAKEITATETPRRSNSDLACHLAEVGLARESCQVTKKDLATSRLRLTDV